jgi:hypothetical protein
MKKPKILKPEEDAYGQELLAYYNGRSTPEICERDDGYIDATLSPAVYFSSYEDWPLYEKKAMESWTSARYWLWSWETPVIFTGEKV